ncbi:mitochondrial DNA-directed RNA polymerase [Scheffersomyces xylosifermentans]|uniref:mitochondrial DNA-directed RNA polymerase n=1 Tax=Scheffersomyces xylosifermentans TaxID=1304137 RepID=UPI00315DE201
MLSRNVACLKVAKFRCDIQKSVASVRCLTTITASQPQPSGYHMHQFLEHLKHQDQGMTRAPSVHSKTFAEIVENEPEHVTEEQRRLRVWSSDYDPVTRSPFAKDVSHLQSLLEALLTSKNFERAHKILEAIHPLLSQPETFIFSVNKYLQTWSQDPTVHYSDLEEFFSRIEQRYDVMPNERTYAIILAKYIAEDGPYISYLSRFPKSKKTIILSYIDVIGVEGLMKVFADPSITMEDIPEDLENLFREVRNELNQEEKLSAEPEYFKDDTEAPTIDKDADSLRAVDSFGLKIIRHTLLGLKEEADSKEIAAIINEMEEGLEETSFAENETSKLDFFKLYKSLKTDSQRAKFNSGLHQFNLTRQRRLEIRGADGAKEKWKHEFEEMQKRGALPLNKGLNAQLFQWYKNLLPYVKKEAEMCHNLLDGKVSKGGLSADEKKLYKDREHYAPYFVLVPPEKMCVITILELLKLNSTGGIVDGMRAARALISVGKAVELEHKSQSLLKSEMKAFSKKVKSTKQWKRILSNKKSNYIENPDESTDWSYTVYAKLGAVLTNLLLFVAKVPVKGQNPSTGKSITGSQPAFFHTYQFLNGQKLGVIKLHKEIVKQLAGRSMSNCVQPQLLPMLVAPREWNSYNDGGYLYSRSTLVRIKDSAETTAYLRKASDLGNLEEVYDGLNVLGRTAWTVNADVFAVITKYWNSGEEFLDIPPVMDEPKLPEPLPVDAEPAQKFEYQRKLRSALNEAASLRSQRCDTNYKLEIARGFLGEKVFFPHNVDFRGRAYPISPHFNHLGNDLTRSLFLFWEGKEVGERGLEWLKIHLANVYGVDKAPLHERIEFVNDNLENAFESARNPYAEDAWWKKAEKPWQALGVCFELAEAYKLEDPTKFVSHIPIHQDGTCNGLQHYAALGGDVEGAKQVNLIPAERPQDVYKFVASLVQKRIDAEAEEGNKYAVFLQDKITRKVVKQTVMTNVYGVTFVGATAQIKKQIDHHFSGDEDVSDYARYLTMHVFDSIRELFEGAHLIQDWLGDAAKRISKSVRIDYEDAKSNDGKPNHLSSVIWTTPLGLPCVQPYRVSKSQLIKTNLQDISISDPFSASQVDARKQQAAFPPNFVHSLDATHMLMTAKACGEADLSFASVHDSYWTHAADVDHMNKEIRNQFVKLHSSNLIQELKDEFEKRYRNCLQVISIPGDHPLAKEIKEVRRNNVKILGRAMTAADEIYLEKTRLEHLYSEDLEKIKIGKEMVTTVSVTEKYDLNSLTGSTKNFQILVPLKFPDIPSKGDLDVEVVKDSPYFFS